MKNRFALFVIAAIVASATAASASMYDDAFIEDIHTKTVQVGAEANQVHAQAVQAQAAAAKSAGAQDIMGSYATYDKSTDTANYLKLEPKGEGAVSFSIFRKGVHGNQPSCSIDGVARKQGNKYVFVDSRPSMFGTENYRMELRLRSDGIYIVDNGASEWYCGAAMELDYAYFRFSDRTPLSK